MKINDFYYVNLDDYNENFWGKNYIISIDGINFIANVESLQEAMDLIIDYCERDMPGMLLSQNEVDEEEFLDDYICGGNHSRYLSTTEVHIVKEY